MTRTFHQVFRFAKIETRVSFSNMEFIMFFFSCTLVVIVRELDDTE